MSKINLFWFRRDLRLEDNHGLFRALESGLPVLPLFIFDRNILDKLDVSEDARVAFILEELKHLKAALESLGSTILVKYGTPGEIFRQLVNEFDLATVYTNQDYEPYAKERDEGVKKFLDDTGSGLRHLKTRSYLKKTRL